ncbi:hypothetical protein A2J03_21135 [Rhodococcus sp. EPR-157]|nr:hypothetical protein A2J03_21135 [Rhodococcus sp. EPR-157]
MSDIQLAILRALARSEPIDMPELVAELRKELPGIRLAEVIRAVGELIFALRILPLSIEATASYDRPGDPHNDDHHNDDQLTIGNVESTSRFGCSRTARARTRAYRRLRAVYSHRLSRAELPSPGCRHDRTTDRKASRYDDRMDGTNTATTVDRLDVHHHRADADRCSDPGPDSRGRPMTESRRERRQRKQIEESKEKHVDILTMKLGEVLADAYDNLDDESKARMQANPGVSIRHEGRFVIASCAGLDFAMIEHAWLVDDSQTEVDAMTVDGFVPDTIPDDFE